MKKNAKKNYQFGVRFQNDVNFVNTEVYKKYANNQDLMNHELAHKKVVDHFFPNDLAEISQDATGRLWTSNKWMRTTDARVIFKNAALRETYKKILIAGYVQEILDLGLEQYFEQILEAQLKNVKKVAEQLKIFGFQTVFANCYTNDDGKFYWMCDVAGKNFKETMNEWIEAGRWCKNFLKAA